MTRPVTSVEASIAVRAMMRHLPPAKARVTLSRTGHAVFVDINVNELDAFHAWREALNAAPAREYPHESGNLAGSAHASSTALGASIELHYYPARAVA